LSDFQSAICNLKSEIKSILIIKPSSLGDIVHTLPAVAAIRDAHPDAEITWVINPEWTTLLRGNPDLNHVHIFPRGDFSGLNAPRTFWPWIKKTRSLQPDVGFDFQGLLRSALIGKISRAREVWGMSDGREGSRLFYKKVAKVDRRAHAVDRYLKLAEAFGAPINQLRFPLPTGDPLPRFDPFPPYLLLHPFSRGARKSLRSSVVEKICAAFDPVRVVIVGKSSRRITVPENCVNLLNQTTLLQMIWLIRGARFVISVDSGPMHIAAAVTSQLVSIHTWSDPRRVGPYNASAWIWKNGQLLRAGEITEATNLKKGRAFREADIGSLVELVGDIPEVPEARRNAAPEPPGQGADPADR
jgi:heptosyltransferase-1